VRAVHSRAVRWWTLARARAAQSAAACAVGVLVVATASACGASRVDPPADPGIHAIQHVVLIMQENRSFDSYFGTYPGADGYPMRDGRVAVCVPDPTVHHCVRPFHDSDLRNDGGPHGPQNALRDIDGGKMDGFVREAVAAKLALAHGERLKRRIAGCKDSETVGPRCELGEPVDVMGFHDARDIPNYWSYARNYVLQDRMFEPNYGWSLPAHLFEVSAWSARCAEPADAWSCRNDLSDPPEGPAATRKRFPHGPLYGWTDLTYLLHRAGVSWGYYVVPGRRRHARLPSSSAPGDDSQRLESAARVHDRSPRRPGRQRSSALELRP
jgi:phospholipase C